MRALVIASLVAACGPDSKTPDAGPMDAAVDAAPDTPGCQHVVYLSFEGDTFMPGADDAANNVSIVVANAGTVPRTLPAYHPGDANRATAIAAVMTQVQMTLPAVTFTTTRPGGGGYDMIAVGGAASDLGITTARPAAAPLPADCTLGVKKGVAFVFATTVEGAGSNVGNYIVGTYGFMKGVPLSTAANDCMCLGTSCAPSGATCTLGGASTPRDPQGCGAGATFDEQAAFAKLPCDQP